VQTDDAMVPSPLKHYIGYNKSVSIGFASVKRTSKRRRVTRIQMRRPKLRWVNDCGCLHNIGEITRPPRQDKAIPDHKFEPAGEKPPRQDKAIPDHKFEPAEE
jgi:hypothetical protein